MDFCSPASSSSRAAPERTRPQRATHSSLLVRASAAASSKPRKPSTSASMASSKLHPPTSKIPSHPLIEKNADTEPAVILQGLPSPKIGEKSAAGHETSRVEKAVDKDESYKNENDLVADEDWQVERAGIEVRSLKDMKTVAEDEYVETEKSVAFIDDASRTTSIQSDASPSDEIKYSNMVEKENTKGHEDTLAEMEEKKSDSAATSVTDNGKSLAATDILKGEGHSAETEKEAVSLMLENEGPDTEKASKKFLMVSEQQDPSLPTTETKTIVCSEQISKVSACTGQTVPGSLKEDSYFALLLLKIGLFTDNLFEA